MNTASRILTVFVSIFILASCGQGDGPQTTAGTAATPLPTLPEGFCDAINFETLCEAPGIENFNGGATTIIDNPDMSGINVSDKVAQMQKFADEVFGGTKLNLSEAIDFSAGEFYKVKVWSPRPVAVSFKLEETGNPGGGLTTDVNHTGGSNWQELCFDFTGQNVPPPVTALTIIFDLGVLGQAAGDPNNWTFYYDDIEQVSSCTGSGGGATSIDPDSALYSTSGDADLEIPGDYSELTAFGSGSVINEFFADDSTYSPVLAVSSGTGYGANIAQIAYVGFAASFAGAYQTLDFKVKGMPNQILFVKLFDDVDALRINLTSSAYSGALGDGWFQVSIPIADFAGVDLATGVVFESDNTAAMQFTMLLTDIGFSGTGTGGPMIADPGTTPDFVLYGTTAPADVAIPAGGPMNFGSGATFDFAYGADASFNPAIAVTAGNGYGPDTWVAFVAVPDYAAPIAVGFDTFNVKVKGAPDGRVEVKLIGSGDDSAVEVAVGSYAGSTDLGEGWYELNIPFSEFSNPANIPGHTGWLIGPPGDQGDAAFVFLLTDVGFSGTGGSGNTGTTPEFVLFGTTAPADVAIPAGGPMNFGSGAMFDFAHGADATFNPAIAVTAGNGYGPDTWVAFVAVPDYASPIAVGFDTFNVKVKDSPDGRVEVKLIGNGDDSAVEVAVGSYAGSTDLGDGWYQLNIPFSEFSNPANIPGHTGWLIGPPGDQGDAAFVFLLTDVGFSNGGGGGSGGGGGNGTFANGDFESGDLSGWTPGTEGNVTVENTTLDGRTGNVAFLQTTAAPQDVLLSQVALGAGTIVAGDMIDVSFDLYGTLTGDSGVVFVEVIFLNAAGQDEGGRNFVGPAAPYFPTTTWTTNSGTVTAGLGANGTQYDVSGGVTLQLKAACGGVVGCVVDAYLDNVTFTVNGQ